MRLSMLLAASIIVGEIAFLQSHIATYSGFFQPQQRQGWKFQSTTGLILLLVIGRE